MDEINDTLRVIQDNQKIKAFTLEFVATKDTVKEFMAALHVLLNRFDVAYPSMRIRNLQPGVSWKLTDNNEVEQWVDEKDLWDRHVKERDE